MTGSKNILIIGIDGMPWSLQNQLFEAGAMPRLKELAESGATGTLKSTLPAITPAAWGGFQTGMNPGRNGVFDFSAWNPETKKTVSSNSSTLEPTLWEYVSAAGESAGVLNVPMTYPPQEINGFVVTGILTPSLRDDFTYPSDLKDELLSEVPDYHVFTMDTIKDVSPHDDFEGFVKNMKEIVQMRSQAAQHLISSRQPDVMMAHFQASDVLQHTLWPYFDPDHPLNLYSESKTEYIFENFYRPLDSAIGTVIDTYRNHVDDDPLILLASDHGFQPHVKRFNLGNWLVENDYLVANDEGVEDPVLVRLLKTLDFTGRIRELAPQSLKQQIDDTASEIEGRPNPFDWEASAAYSVGRSNEGFIYILDENRSKVIDELTKHLYQIEDPETGKAIVQTVHRKEDVYDGDDLTIMPDLILEPEPGYSFTGGYSPAADFFHRITPDEDFHLGKHHPDGMMILDGPGIVDKEVDAELLDLTPTLLHYLGIQPARELDGTVRTGVFDDTIGEPEKVVQVSDDGSDYQLSEDEEQAVEERLEELGYR